MTGLLPEGVREAVEGRSTYDASESFGVIALVVALVLLFRLQVLEVRRASKLELAANAALALPPLAAVVLTIGARIEVLLQ